MLNLYSKLFFALILMIDESMREMQTRCDCLFRYCECPLKVLKITSSRPHASVTPSTMERGIG
jgi:hypothetical protein